MGCYILQFPARLPSQYRKPACNSGSLTECTGMEWPASENCRCRRFIPGWGTVAPGRGPIPTGLSHTGPRRTLRSHSFSGQRRDADLFLDRVAGGLSLGGGIQWRLSRRDCGFRFYHLPPSVGAFRALHHRHGTDCFFGRCCTELVRVGPASDTIASNLVQFVAGFGSSLEIFCVGFSSGRVQFLHVGLPAPRFFTGLETLFHHKAAGHPAYLPGQRSMSGFWSHYAVALAVKTPLGSRLRVASIFASATYSPYTSGWLSCVKLRWLLRSRNAASRCRTRQPQSCCFGRLISGCAEHPDYLAYTNELTRNHPKNLLPIPTWIGAGHSLPVIKTGENDRPSPRRERGKPYFAEVTRRSRLGKPCG